MTYAARVKRDIERWRSIGWIDASVADNLAGDVDARAKRAFGFGSVLTILAAIMLAAAVLIFVAANWETIARPVRVVSLFALIFAGYVGGAVMKARGLRWPGEGAWLVAGAAFGASIALIGQMYHLSGEEVDAILTWGIGIAFAAVVLRSPASNVFAVGLAGLWLSLAMMDTELRDVHVPTVGFPIMAAVLWALSLYCRSRASRHCLLALLVYYGLLQCIHHRPWDDAAVMMAGVSALFFVLCAIFPRLAERFLAIRQAAVYGLIGFGVAMTLLQVSNSEAIVGPASLAFAGTVVALMLGGRNSAPVRWLAYVMFGAELCVVYLLTVGSMLGTAGFLAAAGLLLAATAFVIFLFERRMRSAQAGQGDRS